MSAGTDYLLEGVTKEHGGRTVLDLPRFEVGAGEVVCLVGPPGSGKTTLLRLLAALDDPSSGEVVFRGHRLGTGSVPVEVRRRITLLFQRPVLLAGTVLANVEYGLTLRGRTEARERARAMLERVHLSHLADRPSHAVSGGEAQLIALARALAIEPDMLLLDEPTNNLDPVRVGLVEEVVAHDHRERETTVVWATHNHFQARRVGERVALLLEGRLVEAAPAGEFFDAPLDPRTAAFVQGKMVLLMPRVRGPFIAALAFGIAGCGARTPQSITLATTTSTQDSGLLDVLVPSFRKSTGVEARVIAVGTGQALEIGRRGDADVLLVHDPDAEKRFMADGFGQSRDEVMSNDFVLVGPPGDPAGVMSRGSMADAFLRLAEEEVTFVSRGDESGTHRKEKGFWKKAGVEPAGEWYIRSGQGMGAVLRMADQKRGYTLADRGTFLALRTKMSLASVCEGDPEAINLYSVIVVSPERHPHVQLGPARRFAEFMQSSEARELIARFGVEKFGQPLFTPRKKGP